MDKEKPMAKKKGFLNYGKDDESEPEDKEEDEGDDQEEEGAADKRLMYLAEQTGVENPKALLKLIKACKEG